MRRAQAQRNADEAQIYYERAMKVEPTNAELLRLYSDFCRETRNDRHRADELHARLTAVMATKRNGSGSGIGGRSGGMSNGSSGDNDTPNERSDRT